MLKCVNGQAPLRLINEFSATSDSHFANTLASSNSNILVLIPHVKQFRNSLLYLVRSSGTHRRVIYATHTTLMNVNTDIRNIISAKETKTANAFCIQCSFLRSMTSQYAKFISTAFLKRFVPPTLQCDIPFDFRLINDVCARNV